MEAEEAQCYCDRSEPDELMIQCKTCKNYYHPGCLRNALPTSLEGDALFKMVCSRCTKGDEEFTRIKLQWLHVVMLTMYNLQLNKQGKAGYFRWKEHICSFIDKHWSAFFGGGTRRKSTTWQGTVAGVLSSGSPHYFVTGSAELAEPGWWKLAQHKPPLIDLDLAHKRQRRESKEGIDTGKVEGLRSRRSRSSYQSAMELKAKRYGASATSKDGSKDGDKGSRGSSSRTKEPPTSQTKPSKHSRTSSTKQESPSKIQASSSGKVSPVAENLSSSAENSREKWLTVRDLAVEYQLPELLLHSEESMDIDSDFEVDPCGMTPPTSPNSLPNMEDILSTLDGSNGIKLEMPTTEKIGEESDSSSNDNEPTIVIPAPAIKIEPMTEHSHIIDPGGTTEDVDSEVSSESEDENEANIVQYSPTGETLELRDTGLKTRKVPAHVAVPPPKPPPPKYMPISIQDERHMLKRLQRLYDKNQLKPELTRLRQKLALREKQRMKGKAVFDIDVMMYRLTGVDAHTKGVHHLNPDNLPTYSQHLSDVRILDRFQHPSFCRPTESGPVSFLNRLVGREDNQLESFHSPYTTRMLKPFIRRDYESCPLKMKLLKEIIAYPNRHDATCAEPLMPSIDYCYVRPQHIPSVNALARQFFWPSIDLSECLQYPDFSCVVLYRKVVIGFAFMVPDVKYNEAYISFIFTHPEWRGAGIATFMIYHLIQTCMGKDVTLHVSATNTAMLLYQKFGFKPEEFILNFYDKYYPESSKECKHAFFLRLRR